MDIKKLQASVIDALEDVKAQEIRLFDTVHLTSLFDRMAIASGTSNRQTKALAASVRDKVKEGGGTVISIEGQDTGEWVLVDLGDMVVHIMQPAIRAYYRLEEIWGDKEIDLETAKRASKRTVSRTVKSSETAPRKATAQKTAASKTATVKKTTAAKKTATAKKTSAVKKSTASKSAGTASKKTASKAAVATKSSSGARKTAAKRAAGTKSA